MKWLFLMALIAFFGVALCNKKKADDNNDLMKSIVNETDGSSYLGYNGKDNSFGYGYKKRDYVRKEFHTLVDIQKARNEVITSCGGNEKCIEMAFEDLRRVMARFKKEF